MDNVLSKTDLKAAQQALYQCAQVEQEIEAAEACGLDCSEDRHRCQAIKTFLTNVNNTYKPKPGSR